MQHWLTTKHSNDIELTSMTTDEFREVIAKRTGFKLSVKDNFYNSYFDWESINPHFNFLYNFENNDLLLPSSFRNSSLAKHEYLLVETVPDLPIIKVKTDYFIQHCTDFIMANMGLGSMIVSEDYTLLMEFTDARAYQLFSNFKIATNEPG